MLVNGLKRISILVLFSIILFTTNSFSKNNFTLIGSSQNGGYLAYAEQMPTPVGGIASIYKKIEYPEIAKRSGVEGKVYVLAFINESGGVDDVKIIKGIGAGCDEAAMAAVRNTKFTAGAHKGQAAKVKLSLAIIFKLR